MYVKVKKRYKHKKNQFGELIRKDGVPIERRVSKLRQMDERVAKRAHLEVSEEYADEPV